jgi:hypothetical protein
VRSHINNSSLCLTGISKHSKTMYENMHSRFTLVFSYIVFSCLDIPVKHSLSLFIYYFYTRLLSFGLVHCLFRKKLTNEACCFPISCTCTRPITSTNCVTLYMYDSASAIIPVWFSWKYSVFCNISMVSPGLFFWRCKAKIKGHTKYIYTSSDIKYNGPLMSDILKMCKKIWFIVAVGKVFIMKVDEYLRKFVRNTELSAFS